MEVLKCVLMGYQTTEVLRSAKNSLHPSEFALLQRVAPMGIHYAALSKYWGEVSSGKIAGFYAAAVAVAIQRILQMYDQALEAAETPSAVQQLGNEFDSSLALLERFVSTESLEQRLKILKELVTCETIDLKLRMIVGESVVMSMLHVAAHWIAHGSLLRGSEEFFVLPDSSSPGGFALDERNIPPGFPTDLAVNILLAGKERMTFLRECAQSSESQSRFEASSTVSGGGDSDRVFNSIYDRALCQGGILATDELDNRVEAARNLWSRSLWSYIGKSVQLVEHINTIRDMFTCRRGDLWHTFVEGCFGAVCCPYDAGSGSALRGSGRGIRETSRAVVEAFRSAMSSTSLADREIFDRFRLTLGGATDSTVPPRNIEDCAVSCLNCIDRMKLQIDLPRGVGLVITADAMNHYQQLLRHHLSLKFALFALQSCQRFCTEVSRKSSTSQQSSSCLTDILLLLHHLTFLLINYSYFLQIDLQESSFASLQSSLSKLDTVQAARDLHSACLSQVVDGAFFVSSARTELANAIGMTFTCSIALYALCSRPEAKTELQSERANSEFRMWLKTLQKKLKYEIFPTLATQLSVATKTEHRALWTRIDSNKWLSRQWSRAAAEAQPRRVVSATATISIPTRSRGAK